MSVPYRRITLYHCQFLVAVFVQGGFCHILVVVFVQSGFFQLFHGVHYLNRLPLLLMGHTQQRFDFLPYSHLAGILPG